MPNNDPNRTARHLTPAMIRIMKEVSQGSYIVKGKGYWFDLTTHVYGQHRTISKLLRKELAKESVNPITSEIFLTLTDYGKSVVKALNEG